jgi:hypothetical protein
MHIIFKWGCRFAVADTALLTFSMMCGDSAVGLAASISAESLYLASTFAPVLHAWIKGATPARRLSIMTLTACAGCAFPVYLYSVIGTIPLFNGVLTKGAMSGEANYALYAVISAVAAAIGFMRGAVLASGMGGAEKRAADEDRRIFFKWIRRFVAADLGLIVFAGSMSILADKSGALTGASMVAAAGLVALLPFILLISVWVRNRPSLRRLAFLGAAACAGGVLPAGVYAAYLPLALLSGGMPGMPHHFWFAVLALLIACASVARGAVWAYAMTRR